MTAASTPVGYEQRDLLDAFVLLAVGDEGNGKQLQQTPAHDEQTRTGRDPAQLALSIFFLLDTPRILRAKSRPTCACPRRLPRGYESTASLWLGLLLDHVVVPGGRLELSAGVARVLS